LRPQSLITKITGFLAHSQPLCEDICLSSITERLIKKQLSSFPHRKQSHSPNSRNCPRLSKSSWLA